MMSGVRDKHKEQQKVKYKDQQTCYIVQHDNNSQANISNLLHLLQCSIAILQTFHNLHFNLGKLQIMHLEQH